MDNNHDAPGAPGSPSSAEPPALSERELAARRANARKSTGPRSVEGKAASRFNALKHGFFACDVVNAELDGAARAEEFNSMLEALLDEFQPQSARERILIDEVASCCWRVRRLLRYECRESWLEEDNARRWAVTERPTDPVMASLGYDKLAIRRATAARLERSGLDAFALPSHWTVDTIVRFERSIKRDLHHALELLEQMRATRDHVEPWDEDPWGK